MKKKLREVLYYSFHNTRQVKAVEITVFQPGGGQKGPLFGPPLQFLEITAPSGRKFFWEQKMQQFVINLVFWRAMTEISEFNADSQNFIPKIMKNSYALKSFVDRVGKRFFVNFYHRGRILTF